MSVNTNNEIIAPTINSVKLNYKQKFPTKEEVETINGVTITPNGVAKNTIKFRTAIIFFDPKYPYFIIQIYIIYTF